MGLREGQLVYSVCLFEVTVVQGVVLARVAAAGGRLIPCRRWRRRVSILKVELARRMMFMKVGNSRHLSAFPELEQGSS